MKQLIKFTATNFKQHERLEVNFSEGISVLAGANNAGKSSLLQAIGVWEFCKTVLLSERGSDALLPGSVNKQGIGVEYNNFTAISIPSFKHLWTNLQSSLRSENNGYSLTLELIWKDDSLKFQTALRESEKFDDFSELEKFKLKFGLSLANNTLFIKLLDSNINIGQEIIRAVYLPPISSVKAHEEKLNIPARRRKIGEGLAGDVLRNILFDHYLEYESLRKKYTTNPDGSTKKIKVSDQKLLNSTAWKKITNKAEELFSIDIVVENYIEEYHSFIDIKVVPSSAPSKAKKWQRDIMFEGSGFIQWVCVFAFAYSKDNDILLLDEPDSHLHPLLQKILISELDKTSISDKKSILISSHSPEILKGIQLNKILRISKGRRSTRAKYLQDENDRRSLLEGIGTSYFERIYRISEKGKIIFYEGVNDKSVLLACANALGVSLEDWVFWETQDYHLERYKIFKILKEDFPDLIAVSIRDRDEENVNNIDRESLIPKGVSYWDQNSPQYDRSFLPQTYLRRELENYFLHPKLVAKASSKFSRKLCEVPDDQIESRKIELIEEYYREEAGFAINDKFFDVEAPDSVMDVEGKKILKKLEAHKFKMILKDIKEKDICQDLQKIIKNIDNLGQTGSNN